MILIHPFTKKEVTFAVLSYVKKNVSSLDDFMFSFIKTFWNLMCVDIFLIIKILKEHAFIISQTSALFITLVLILNDPLSLPKYRP